MGPRRVNANPPDAIVGVVLTAMADVMKETKMDVRTGTHMKSLVDDVDLPPAVPDDDGNFFGYLDDEDEDAGSAVEFWIICAGVLTFIFGAVIVTLWM